MIIDEKYITRPIGIGYSTVPERRTVPHVERIRPAKRVQDEQEQNKKQEHSAGPSPGGSFKEEHRKAAEKKHRKEQDAGDLLGQDMQEEETVTISKAFYMRLLAENQELQELIGQLRSTLSYSMTGIRQQVMSYQVVAKEQQLKELAGRLLYLEQQKTAYMRSTLESPSGWQIESFILDKDEPN